MTAKYRAWQAVSIAVKDGRLRKASDLVCVDCGAPAAHYDHRDYLKPLDVDPVCVGCNRRRGAGLNRNVIVDGKPNALSESIIIRVTPRDHAKFHSRAIRAGFPSVSEWCRELMRHGVVRDGSEAAA